jgi:3-dehydroshikimate dehydratase
MITLSGFADEISPDLNVQIQTLTEEGIKFLELRGVGGKNVLDFTIEEREDIKKRLDDAGIGVSSIASPLGKVRIDLPWAAEIPRINKILDTAAEFEAPFIRVFSYYPPEGEKIADQRDEVIWRMKEKIGLAAGMSVQFLHENEKEIYGYSPEACLDLAQNVTGMPLVFDPANFVQVGVKPLEAWNMLHDNVAYFHIKDALLDGGKIVPPGEGDASIREILKDAILNRGYNGFISLEPHLSVAGKSSGFSGPDLFKKAVRLVKAMLTEMGVEYR